MFSAWTISIAFRSRIASRHSRQHRVVEPRIAGARVAHERLEGEHTFGLQRRELRTALPDGGRVEPEVGDRASLRERTLRVQALDVVTSGSAWGISTTVVIPPATAEAVPWAKSSRSIFDGSRRWVWMSTPPGKTYRPVASRRSPVSPDESSTSPADPTVADEDVRPEDALLTDDRPPETISTTVLIAVVAP